MHTRPDTIEMFKKMNYNYKLLINLKKEKILHDISDSRCIAAIG